ncbi:DUF1488 family protein [Caballeronia sp. GAOx1]|uniref:DUF1488 family protein n=1 Tax=Caballeronia sp. GAOx1 TaxID=2921761 RepID=UPI002028298D|nr:DUF1488 family protein [Caballeronia sp. GAOx1]
MKFFVPEPHFSADKQVLNFVVEWRGESVTCVMPRRCMQVVFWLQPDADDARPMSGFRNGFCRSEVVARRKLLARSRRPVHITAADLSVLDRQRYPVGESRVSSRCANINGR